MNLTYKKILLVLVIVGLSCTTYSQKKTKNALLFPQLIVNDIVPLDANYFTGFNYTKQFNSQSIINLLFKENVNLKQLIIDKLLDSTYIVYDDFSPYENVYFDNYQEVFKPTTAEEIKNDLGVESEIVQQINDEGVVETLTLSAQADPQEIKGLLFYDEWFFDEKEFLFTKNVLSYCPVRKYRSEKEEDEWLFKKVAHFVFNNISKREKRKSQKRMVYLGRISYEFCIDNKLYFGIIDDEDNGPYLEEINSPYWNSYSRQKIRTLLINRVISGRSKAYDYVTNDALSIEESKKKLGYKMQQMEYYDPATSKMKTINVETEIYKEDIKSLLFVEDWYIDPVSMRIHKEVIGIAPIRFYTTDETTEKKEVAFVVYFQKK